MLIDFVKYKYLFFAVSLIYLVPGIISLLVFGLKSSIDFTGGAIIEVRFKETGENQKGFGVDMEKISALLQKNNFEVSSVQPSGQGQFILKMKPVEEAVKVKIINSLEQTFGSVDVLRFDSLGPTLGQEALLKALAAVILGLLLIFIYIAYQFHDYVFGVAAIIATVHDALVVLGSLSLLGHFFGVEVDVLFVTALLTTLSFSVHDTVVVYDRIRESTKHFPKAGMETLVNKASNETLIRSLNNSLTVIFMLIALFLLGGPSIKWFSLTLLIGTITGTYSSVCTAAPLLVVWRNFVGRSKGWSKKFGK